MQCEETISLLLGGRTSSSALSAKRELHSAAGANEEQRLRACRRVADGHVRAPSRSLRVDQKCITTPGSLVLVLAIGSVLSAFAQKPRIPAGGHLAVVADERLAALRREPDLSSRLVRRLGRGRFVSIRGYRRLPDGLTFYRVAINRRTSGWLQSDAVVAGWHAGDDQRLSMLLDITDEFERVARARIFLATFQHSPLRPKVLLTYGDAAEEAAGKLSREAERRFEKREVPSGGAPEFSYYLNYSGLDRFNRQGVTFTFDQSAKRFHYEGWAWREIVRRYPGTAEALEARIRIDSMAKSTVR